MEMGLRSNMIGIVETGSISTLDEDLIFRHSLNVHASATYLRHRVKQTKSHL